MKTWKNRHRHPKKTNPKKTRSRKQRGGDPINIFTIQDFLKRNPDPKLQELVSDATQAGLQTININDRRLLSRIRGDEASQLGRPVVGQDPAGNAFASSLRSPDSFAQANPMRKNVPPAPSDVFAQANPMRGGPAAAPPPAAPVDPKVLESVSQFNARDSAGLEEGPGINQADLPIDAGLNPGGAEARLGAIPQRPALPQAPAPGGLVYSMKGFEGKSQTVSDCSKQLDKLREELATLKSGFAESQAMLQEKERSLTARIAELDAERGQVQATADALSASLAKLGGDKKELADALDTAQQTLSIKGAKNAALLADIAKLRGELGAAGALTTEQEKELAAIRGAIQEAERAAREAAEKNAGDRLKLIADHNAELAKLREEHAAALSDLRRDLETARLSSEAEKGASAEEKGKLNDDIAELRAKIAAQEKELNALADGIRDSAAALFRQKGEAEAAAAAAAAAAATADEQAKAAAARLAELQAANAALEERIAAAEAGAAASAEAARDAETRRAAAAEASVAAGALALEAAAKADQAARDADEARAAKGTSEADKAAAESAAAAAKEAADAAKAEAGDAQAEAEAAAGAQEAAQAAQAAAERALAALKESTPRIVTITGEDGQKVGDGGRAAIMNETLRVQWEKGGATPDAWVFVMFAADGDKVPEYTQLITKLGLFEFTSTVAGSINAVIFDVVVHSRETLFSK